MAYIGKQPLVGNYISCDSLSASATTTYNLTSGGSAVSPQTAANCIVSLNGVVQAPTSSYTISGSTIIFSTTLSTSDTIDYITVLGNVLNIGTPTNGTVTTSSLASGFSLPATQGGTGTTTYTAGNILYASNATTLTTLAPGTSGYALTLNGTTPAWTALPTSDFVLLATTDASSSSSVSFDGYFSSTYKNYKVMFSSVKPSTNQYFYMRARQSNADVTSSLYYGAGSGRNQYYLAPDLSQEQSNFGNNIFSGGTALTLWDFSYYNGADSNRQVNSATYSSVNGSFEIFDPLSTSTWKQLHGKISYRGTGNAGASSFGITYIDMALLFQASTGSALSGITFYPSTGTFTSGNFKLYGIK